MRRADGSYGAVQAIVLIAKSQVMYNLTIEGAHTFFVGNGQWLVHNVNNCNVTISKVAEDWAEKGAHIHVQVGNGEVELVVRPNGTGDGVVFDKFFSSTSDADAAKAIKIAQDAMSDPNFVAQLYDRVSKSVGYVLNYPASGGLGRSAELNFLAKTLANMLKAIQ